MQNKPCTKLPAPSSLCQAQYNKVSFYVVIPK